MIINGLLNVIYSVLDFLLIFSIPELPSQAQGYIDTLFDYMVGATGIVANYTPLGYLLILFGIIVTVDVAILLYKLVMWILRKIPLAGIS